MNKKEFEAVIKLPANVRYEYFIKKWLTMKKYGGCMITDGL